MMGCGRNCVYVQSESLVSEAVWAARYLKMKLKLANWARGSEHHLSQCVPSLCVIELWEWQRTS